MSLHLSWELSVSSGDRETEVKTVSLTTQSWDLRGLLVKRFDHEAIPFLKKCLTALMSGKSNVVRYLTSIVKLFKIPKFHMTTRPVPSCV